MSMELGKLAEQLKSSQPLTARDTLGLRQWAWGGDGVISQFEAESLFELNNLGKSNAPQWVEFFVEAISEFVVNQQPPKGYVSDEHAAWLMAQIDRDGRVESIAELELLVKVLERATNAPNALKAYALKQIETVVLTGEGPTRSGGDIHAGRIDEAEVVLLRRLIFASGGSGPASVSQEEAEMLFRIKDATLGAGNAAGWQQLFVQGVGNFLMAHVSYQPMSRDEAILREGFMNDAQARVGGFLSRVLGAPDWGEAWKALTDNDDLDEIAAREKAAAEAAEVSGIESAWLRKMVDANGAQDDLERALAEFLKRG